MDKKLGDAQNLIRVWFKKLFNLSKSVIKSYVIYLVYAFTFFTIYALSGFEVTVILLLIGILRGFANARQRT